MGMLNNTAIRVRIPASEVIQKAYSKLVNEGMVPYTRKQETTGWGPDYECTYKDGKLECVEFFLSEQERKKPQPEKQYEAGGWRDPELSNE